MKFELHTAWKYISNQDGIRECECSGAACGAAPSPCSCSCSGNLGTPIVGDKMRSIQRFEFGDNQRTSVAFTVMALDSTNDVLFAKSVFTHEYSYAGGQSEYVAGFFYENRPSDIENDSGAEVRILSNVKSSSFHMSADPADLQPGSERLSLEMTKRGNSPILSSSLPLFFDIPTSRPHSFSFPAMVRAHHILLCCHYWPFLILTYPSQQDVRVMFKNWIFSFCSVQQSSLFGSTTVPLGMTIDSSSGSISIPPQPDSRLAGRFHLCISATNSFAFTTMVRNSHHVLLVIFNTSRLHHIYA